MRVVCECYETKVFGTVAGNLARNYDAGWMRHLAIDYLGGREHEHGSGFPDLSVFQGGAGLRVTLEQGDFPALKLDSDAAKFQSTSVKRLELMWCDLVSVPPVSGFPSLARLEMVECMFADVDGDVLGPLLDAPVPPIEYLGLVGCYEVGDVSPIAALAQRKLKTLVIHECQGGDYPYFDHAATVVLKGKLVDVTVGGGGELNAGGTGCLCKVAVRRLGIRKAEREAVGLVQCSSECCGPCECGECSDCE